MRQGKYITQQKEKKNKSYQSPSKLSLAPKLWLQISENREFNSYMKGINERTFCILNIKIVDIKSE